MNPTAGNWSAADHAHMARALQLAERGRYSTHPNPRVGCVLVNNGQTVGEGWHRRAGEPHAEVNALRQAGEAARGATVYVTLEPCCHHGRTPPCSQALVDAGVARVVAAMRDPNPRVDGGGLEQIRSAGIVVESGLLEIQARRLNRGFISRMERVVPTCGSSPPPAWMAGPPWPVVKANGLRAPMPVARCIECGRKARRY